MRTTPVIALTLALLAGEAGAAAKGTRIFLIVDNSYSMTARGRFYTARDAARSWVEALPVGALALALYRSTLLP